MADPVATDATEQELATIDSRDVLADVIAFLDVRGVDITGEPVRLDGDMFDTYSGRETDLDDLAPTATRLMNVTAACEERPEPRQLQLLDAGEGGLWLVQAVPGTSETDGGEPGPESDVMDLIPTTGAEIVARILATLSR